MYKINLIAEKCFTSRFCIIPLFKEECGLVLINFNTCFQSCVYTKRDIWITDYKNIKYFKRSNLLNLLKVYSYFIITKCYFSVFQYCKWGWDTWGATNHIQSFLATFHGSLPFIKRVLSLWIIVTSPTFFLWLQIQVLLHNLVEKNRVTSWTAM